MAPLRLRPPAAWAGRLLVGLGLLAAPWAQAACLQGGVEWIVGGSAPAPCDDPAVAARPAPARGETPPEQRVAPALQLQRDGERLRILQQELGQEEALLAAATDPLQRARARGNVAALQREMARLQRESPSLPAPLRPPAAPLHAARLSPP